jgi:membrane fusion protein, copper/silver efflux system
MKRFWHVTVVLTLAAGAFLVGSRFSQRQDAATASPNGSQVLYYVDPMNPAHTSDKPGLAPCGMKMEAVYADEPPAAAGAGSGVPLLPGTVKVSPEKQQLIGVEVATAEPKALRHTLRLPGRVALDETRIYRINATVDGWITRALSFAAGSPVKKDETLAEFYSPEFLAAGQALIFALGSADRVQATGRETEMQRSQMANFDLNLKQYRDALRNLGMGELQIQELVRTRKLMQNVQITSPADGFILARNVSEGQRFEKGTELFRLADLSRVWILADLFEGQARFIQPGSELRVSLPHQNKTVPATVGKALPQFDSTSRTLKLRLEAENPEFILKPDMFVDLEVPVNLPETLAVPAEAVLDAGARRTVFVDRGGGYFEPRLVETGWRFGDQVQITHGLMAGERIAISGNFLLDSESRMKLAAAGVHGAPARDPICGMAVDEAKARAAGRVSEYLGQTVFFCAEACKKTFDSAPDQHAGGPRTAPPAGVPPATAPAKDPICGMAVDVAKARAAQEFSEYRGTTCYFCSLGCKEEFDKNPADHRKAAPAGTAAAPPATHSAKGSSEPGPARDQPHH